MQCEKLVELGRTNADRADCVDGLRNAKIPNDGINAEDQDRCVASVMSKRVYGF